MANRFTAFSYINIVTFAYFVYNQLVNDKFVYNF